jgi:hypothetical protein
MASFLWWPNPVARTIGSKHDEFIGAAKQRGAYLPAGDSCVEHLHPSWGKGRTDATYQRALANFETDRVYFESRRHLWGATGRPGFW